MSSMSGYITYIKYTIGSNKGESSQGDVINDPFRLGKVDVNYTSDKVVESVESTGGVDFAWGPAVSGSVYAKLSGTWTEVSDSLLKKDGTKIIGIKPNSFAEGTKVKYLYDNIVIPQNDVPIINAEMASMTLLAKARRVAVYYSQIAAYQAKTDYGFDLADQLAEKAVGQLSYEIDTEVTNLLIDNAVDHITDNKLTWSRSVPVGVSKAEHYEGFTEIVEIGRQLIYDATKRFAPNYILIASDVLPVLTFIKGFQAAPAGQINGPYYAGTLNSLKVFVTPNITAGQFVIGCNGNDMMSSAAVYAPYMAIVPTQLMQFNDGGTTQGWSTLYDLKMLNSDLVVKGQIIA